MPRVVRMMLAAVVLVLVVAALVSIVGIGSSSLSERSVTSVTTLVVTVSGTKTITVTEFAQSANQSTLIVTEEVFMGPAIVNLVCVWESTTTVVSTSYVLPAISVSQGFIGSITTTTLSVSGSIPTIYDNITIGYQVNGSESSCTMINPYYHVTQNLNPNCFCE